MTYAEALDFWFRRVNFELRSPLPDELKLDRMRRLLALLGNPQDRLRILHVAGSKGKGSTAAMLASVLGQAGYRVGLFTSPHLVGVAERIQVDRQPITPEQLTDLMTEIQDRTRAEPWGAESLASSLTFFEIATGLGFLHFAREQVDAAVVEVGLGGRFDSTNVCDPLVSIITSISYDHVPFLGNTLARIAGEKAGIIKLGRPVVSGVRAPEARDVIERVCAEQAAPLAQLDRDFQYTHTPACIRPPEETWPQVKVTTRDRAYPALRLGLLGEHQAANAAVALAALEVAREAGLPVTDAALAAGLAQVQWPARLEIVRHRPLIILDCAHNLASVEALLQTLDSSFPLPPSARRWLLFAGSRDKDLPAMVELLGKTFDRVRLTRFTTNPRSMAPEELLAGLAANLTSKIDRDDNPLQALNKVLDQAQLQDLICVTGSVYLAGELRPHLVAA